ncbi:hypothetical protein LZ012_07525 [Dechloromonas sp. XY25]|uniref:DUF3455 domain-containing protein n=1 Tax=Dechloromonas hankyongensis TaxID=2908002 RepID=A0ABS9K103_9RHOO|nr:hypothetical protein [Dechloromonas hankyongensis]MCG2576841.1 hypothetical protein [Dechloromonas hankyongensis]
MKLLGLLLLLPALASAETVFDGYGAYYATLPGQLFNSKGINLHPYSVRGDKGIRLAWSGTAGGRHHTLEIRNGVLAIDGLVLKPSTVTTFPDEVVNDGDLGIGTTAYFAPGWACVENTPMSASGTAVRHKAVYLMRLANPKPQAWKLPSLFQACEGIRQQANRIVFDKIEYRYRAEEDNPVGISLKEYIIRGKTFIPSGNSRSATFVESGNVYRFVIDPR